MFPDPPVSGLGVPVNCLRRQAPRHSACSACRYSRKSDDDNRNQQWFGRFLLNHPHPDRRRRGIPDASVDVSYRTETRVG